MRHLPKTNGKKHTGERMAKELEALFDEFDAITSELDVKQRDGSPFRSRAFVKMMATSDEGASMVKCNRLFMESLLLDTGVRCLVHRASSALRRSVLRHWPVPAVGSR